MVVGVVFGLAGCADGGNDVDRSRIIDEPRATLTRRVATVAPPPATGGDRDCADFGSQREAQAFYEAQGGPERDPHRLDRDRDGLACELN